MATNKRKSLSVVNHLRMKLDDGTELVVGPKSGDPMQIFCIPHGCKIIAPGDDKLFLVHETERFQSIEVINAPEFVLLQLSGDVQVYSKHSFHTLWKSEDFINACEELVKPARIIEVEPIYKK